MTRPARLPSSPGDVDAACAAVLDAVNVLPELRALCPEIPRGVRLEEVMAVAPAHVVVLALVRRLELVLAQMGECRDARESAERRLGQVESAVRVLRLAAPEAVAAVESAAGVSDPAAGDQMALLEVPA